MRRPLVLLLAVMAAGIGALSVSGVATACSGARVTFDEINAEATRVVVGTIRAIQGDPSAPDGLAITVEGVVRGIAAPDIFLVPPTYMGCDGRIAEPIGARLLIATGRQYFDANAPEDLHPYWLIGPADTLEPAGVEDSDPRHRTLGGLVAALGGELVPVRTAEPGETVDEPSAVDEVGPPLAVVFALIAAATSVFGVVIVVARRRGPAGR